MSLIIPSAKTNIYSLNNQTIISYSSAARDSSRIWYSIASSSDGSKLAAVVFTGQIYTSTNSGSSWTARDSTRNWFSITSSSDGSKLAAVVFTGQIYTSTDSGVSWTARDSTRNWFSITSSSDGAKLAAVVDAGNIYTSTDSGVSWTARDSARNWRSITSSSDGTKLAAVVNGGQIYTSTDSGVSWTARDSTRSWFSITSSSDGSKLAAAVIGGQIYTSIDSGVSWTARDSTRDWRSIASSSDGSRLAAVVDGGQIYSIFAYDRGTINIAPTSVSITAATLTNLNSVFVDSLVISSTSATTGTNASSLYVRGAPIIGTNITNTNTYAVNIADGRLAFTSTSGTNLNGVSFSVTNTANPYTSTTNTPGRILLNDNPIYTRNDANHFLCHGNISGVTYGGTTVDGPALVGYAGGLLGSSNGGLAWALSWDNSTNVTINNRLLIDTNGSTSSPAISWTSSLDGSTNTGIYKQSDDRIAITCGGSQVCAWGSVSNNAVTGNTSTSFGLLSTSGAGTASNSNSRAYVMWVRGNLAVGGTADGGDTGTINGQSANEINVYSDRRIKTNIRPIPDEEIDKFLLFEPIYYNYFNCSTQSIGFIAQDIEKVESSYTNPIHEYIPNIFKKLPIRSVSEHKGLFNINLDALYQIEEGDILKLIDSKKHEIQAQVNSIREDILTIYINEENLKEFTPGEEIFIYGKLVNDFLLINEMSIFKHHMVFTKKMYRTFNARIDALELENQNMRARLDRLETVLLKN